MEIGETTAKDADFEEEAVVILPSADPACSVAYLEQACRMSNGGKQ